MCLICLNRELNSCFAFPKFLLSHMFMHTLALTAERCFVPLSMRIPSSFPARLHMGLDNCTLVWYLNVQP